MIGYEKGLFLVGFRYVAPYGVQPAELFSV